MAIIHGTATSKSNPTAKPYTFSLDTDTGKGTCNCKGWLMNAARNCTHLKALKAENGLTDSAPTSSAPKAPTKPVSPKTGKLSPMLASAMPEGKTIASFTDGLHVCEVKYDGHRLLVEKTGGTILAYSRTGVTRELPKHLLSALAPLPDGIYDGELLLNGGTSTDVTRLDKQAELVFVVFDILQVFGVDVKGKPLSERRAMLELAVKHCTNPSVVLSAIVPVTMAAVQAIWNASGENVIIKQLNSTYRCDYRTAAWVKVKKQQSATLQIIGFKAGKFGPYSTILLRDQFGVETSVKTLNADWLRMFTVNATTNGGNPTSYIGKLLVISYNIKTADGKYRHPMADHIL